MTFRRATLDDVDDLVALVESAYRGEASRQGWTTEADLLEGQRTDGAALNDVIASADAMMLIAEEAQEAGEAEGHGQKGEAASTGRLVGCCGVESRAARVAHFGMFAVRPGSQGRGLGRVILEEAQRVASTAMGARTMQMTVIRQRAELIAWYERLGYARTGERVPFPYGKERYGLPTVPDLEFVVLSRPLVSPPAGPPVSPAPTPSASPAPTPSPSPAPIRAGVAR